MYNIKFRNCGLLSYGTVLSKWSEETISPGPTDSSAGACRQTKNAAQNIHIRVCTRLYGVLTHHLMVCVDRPKMLFQNIHNRVCTRLYGVLTQTTLWILTIVSTSNPVPKIIQNWKGINHIFRQPKCRKHVHTKLGTLEYCVSRLGRNSISRQSKSRKWAHTIL